MAMTIEKDRLNDVLKWEEENLYSREKVTIKSGEDLPCGGVVARIKTTCPTTGTADSGNTGNGTCTSVSAGKQVKEGTYTLTCIAAAADAGTFEVRDPDDLTLGQAEVGVAYTSEQINFTLNDGTADFVVGDKFTIVVAAGSRKVVKINNDGVNGSEDPIGFVIDAYDAAGGDIEGVVIARNALIDPDNLAWPMAFTSGGTYEIQEGDVITGATSGDTAEVVKVTRTSGTWSGGTAAGTLWVKNNSGEFEAENLDVGSESNVATISAALQTANGLAAMKELGILERESA